MPSHPGDPVALPHVGRPVFELVRQLRHPRLVRHRLDRAAERDPAPERHDRGARGRLRLPLPLPERPDRRADAARPGDRRPGEGFGHERLPTVTRCTTRVRATTCSGSSRMDRSKPTVLWSFDSRTQPGMMLERRLGRRAVAGRRLPARGRRELLVLRDPAASPLRRRRPGPGEPADRDARARLGPAAAQRSGRSRRLDRELGRVPRTASCTSRTPAGWCRAGTSPTC